MRNLGRNKFKKGTHEEPGEETWKEPDSNGRNVEIKQTERGGAHEKPGEEPDSE